MAETKPRAAFPSMYALLWPMMVEAARDCGYAVALHGSLARDMDVIAVPWTEDAVPAAELVERLCDRAGFRVVDGGRWNTQRGEFDIARDPTEKPHGRLAWSLHLTGGAYVDLSVMPPRRPVPPEPPTGGETR